MRVQWVFKDKGLVEIEAMSTPSQPSSQAEQGGPEQEVRTWDDIWDLCLAHGASPAIFAPPGERGLKFSPLFAALLDLEEGLPDEIGLEPTLYRFLKILLESLDPLSKGEYTPS